MANSWISTDDRYCPILKPSGHLAETVEEYCERMWTLLPRFPPEVLSQWFYDHWSQIDQYAWLDYSSLRFALEDWTSDQVMGSGIQDNASIQIDRRHFHEGVTNEDIERIARHFGSQGTWPVPPVFLANHEATIVRPDGWKLTSPFHLLEGHHRCGLFWHFFDQEALCGAHDVWVARINLA